MYRMLHFPPVAKFTVGLNTTLTTIVWIDTYKMIKSHKKRKHK
jgi:hypothetical protein